jgi:hypothetical protein
MPRGDGTGPAGLGPMTGRAAGFCTGYSVPGYMNPAWGRGRGRGFGFFGRGGRGFGNFGRGRGGGRGWRHWYYATGLPGWARGGFGPGPYAWPPAYGAYGPEMSAKEEIGALQEEAELLRKEIDDIEKRIASLEKEETK